MQFGSLKKLGKYTVYVYMGTFDNQNTKCKYLRNKVNKRK